MWHTTDLFTFLEYILSSVSPVPKSTGPMTGNAICSRRTTQRVIRERCNMSQSHDGVYEAALRSDLPHHPSSSSHVVYHPLTHHLYLRDKHQRFASQDLQHQGSRHAASVKN